MTKLMVAALLAALSLSPALAGKKDTFAYWAEGDNAAKKVWFEPAHASMKKFGAVEMPRRVGLISFYIFDTRDTKWNAMARTYGGTFFERWRLNKRGANRFSTGLAERGVPVLKEAFAAQGMELLLPTEFLETEAQIHAYTTFELPDSAMKKFTKSVVNFLEKNVKASGAADGYDMIATHVWMDRDVQRAVEELRLALGLDALVVLANTTSSDKNGVALMGTSLEIFGPNPEAKPDNKMAAKYWTPGIRYVRGNFGKGFKGVPFATMKKGQVTGESYEGYEGIVRGLAQATLAELSELHEKGR